MKQKEQSLPERPKSTVLIQAISIVNTGLKAMQKANVRVDLSDKINDSIQHIL